MDAYDFFREGQARLRKGQAAQATVPLERAKRLEPAKASIREALGIAYFRLGRWGDFAVAEPVDVATPLVVTAKAIIKQLKHQLALTFSTTAPTHVQFVLLAKDGKTVKAKFHRWFTVAGSKTLTVSLWSLKPTAFPGATLKATATSGTSTVTLSKKVVLEA